MESIYVVEQRHWQRYLGQTGWVEFVVEIFAAAVAAVEVIAAAAAGLAAVAVQLEHVPVEPASVHTRLAAVRE
jgi:hypothetical protein